MGCAPGPKRAHHGGAKGSSHEAWVREMSGGAWDRSGRGRRPSVPDQEQQAPDATSSLREDPRVARAMARRHAQRSAEGRAASKESTSLSSEVRAPMERAYGQSFVDLNVHPER